jgi:hypothetical protein
VSGLCDLGATTPKCRTPVSRCRPFRAPMRPARRVLPLRRDSQDRHRPGRAPSDNRPARRAGDGAGARLCRRPDDPLAVPRAARPRGGAADLLPRLERGQHRARPRLRGGWAGRWSSSVSIGPPRPGCPRSWRPRESATWGFTARWGSAWSTREPCRAAGRGFGSCAATRPGKASRMCRLRRLDDARGDGCAELDRAPDRAEPVV